MKLPRTIGKPQRRGEHPWIRYTRSDLVDPFGKDRDDLAHANNNATALAEKLSRRTAEPVTVKPVLVLPGWYVERTGRSEVAVVNDHKNQLRAANRCATEMTLAASSGAMGRR